MDGQNGGSWGWGAEANEGGPHPPPVLYSVLYLDPGGGYNKCIIRRTPSSSALKTHGLDTLGQ